MARCGPQYDISMRNVDEIASKEQDIGNITNAPVLTKCVVFGKLLDLSKIQFLFNRWL